MSGALVADVVADAVPEWTFCMWDFGATAGI
jgi:hypothetical protein